MRKWLVILLFLVRANFLWANFYLVYFKDKSIYAEPKLSAQNLIRHQRQNIAYDNKDKEVYKEYLLILSKQNCQIIGSSRWLNAACIAASEHEINTIKSLPFVSQVEAFQSLTAVNLETVALGPSTILSSERQLQMMQLDRLHQMGYTGKGMHIAVFDNGFTRVDKQGPFRHLFKEGRIKQTRNFTDPNRSVYGMGTDGEHGARVLSVLAALMPPLFVGSAFDANYFLAVTEDMTREGQLEEWNWLMAAEWADSLGTDIISTSLGYATNFTYGGDHLFEEMDGHTTLISRAANMAASRGILVVNAAGNEGQNAWRHIIAPADADSCLSVGSVDALENYSPFSSQGPNYNKTTKPDVAAMGGLCMTLLPQGWLKTGNGTSFACPLVAGFAACVWQIDPSLGNMNLFAKIKESGHLAQHPDTFLGWGIPHADSIYYWLKGSHLPQLQNVPNQLVLYPNPSNGQFQLSYFNYAEAQQTQLSIYNLLGEKIFSRSLILQNGYAIYPLNMSDLSPKKGIYFLRIEGINQQIIFENKLVICE